MFALQLFAQENNKIAFEGYVGIPNNANYLLYNRYSGTDSTVSNYSTIGTPVLFGFRGEFPSTNRFSFGFDINYEESGFKYNYIDSTSSSNPFETALLTYRAKKLRLMLKGNYYFVDKLKFKTCVNASFGYRYIQRTEKSTAPHYETKYSENSIPFAGRIAVTMKFYPIESVGIFLEVGAFGGSIVQTGLSLRL